MVNVQTFGAVGDGVHDDTTAIQAALNSATDQVYFPAGTYLCNQTSKAPWPDWFPSTHLFVMPQTPLTLYGPGKILTSAPTTLFDTNQNALTIQGLTLQCTSGFTMTDYSFAVLVRGNLECDNVTFIDWTQGIKYLDNSSSACASLKCNGCIFYYSKGIAYADPNYGYPSTAILGGGKTTTLVNCCFDGMNGFPFKPADGFIKTINQVSNLTVTGCKIVNNGIEAISCEGSLYGISVDIEDNKFVSPPVAQGGTCSISLFNVKGKIVI